MTKVRVLVAILFALALVFTGVSPACATPAPRRVVIVLAPYLTWQDVLTGPMPETRRAAADGLVADMNDRSGAGPLSGATAARGALMLSAGASMIEDPTALPAYDASESVGAVSEGAGAAADLYARTFRRPVGAERMLYLGQPQQTVANAVDNPGPVLGALGDAAHRAGAVTVSIGCSDLGLGAGVDSRSRPAGIVVASSSGGVDAGDVSEALLVADATAPYGARTDVSRLRAAYLRALRSAAPAVHPALIVVDPGDLERSHELAGLSTVRTAAVHHMRAVSELDAVVGMVRAQLATGDTLMVVPTTPAVAGALAPLITSGPLGAGLATSPSTHRVGIVTLADVSASAVAALGGGVPPGMVGAAIERAPAPPSSLTQRVDRLQLMADTVVAVEGARVPLLEAYIEVAVLALLAGALVLYRGADGPQLPDWSRSLTRALLLLVACVPLAAVLQFAFVPDPTRRHEVELLLVAVSAALTAGLWLAARGRPATWPLIAVTGTTALLLIVDQWLGAPLSWVSIYDYSPLEGARYYGLGNQMAGLLLGSALVAAALVLDTWRDARWAAAFRTWGWPLMGAVVVITAAAPMLGANFGPVAWMSVGFLAGWLVLNGRRVWTWRNAAFLLALVVVVLAALSVVDVLRGPGQQTHLGRLIGDVGQSGLGSLWILVARKAVTNLRVLGQTRWTWLAAALVALLGYMRWRPQGEFVAMLREYPAFRAALVAALFSSVAGYLTEDSGIIIPALVLMPIGVAVLYLMIARSAPRRGTSVQRGTP